MSENEIFNWLYSNIDDLIDCVNCNELEEKNKHERTEFIEISNNNGRTISDNS